MKPSASRLAAAVAALLVIGVAVAADSPPGRRADQEALKPYAGLVGDWRGVGQPQRQSSKGAWTETAACAWKLSPESAALELTVSKGKYLKSARLRPGEGGHFTLDATLSDDTTRTFHGRPGDRDRLALTADGPAADGVRRVTLTPLHDTRFLLLLEAQEAQTGRFSRLAEIGYTRQGVAFAAGESYPLCIVTEGRGTIPVTYKGRTYHVCCSGCKELFDDDPEAVLAEAEARKKARDAK